jgi:hypothetical protein
VGCTLTGKATKTPMFNNMSYSNQYGPRLCPRTRGDSLH